MNLGLGGVSAARGHADEEYFGNAYDQRVILRLTPFIKPYRKLAIISIIAMLIYTLTLVVVPWMIGYGIDEFIANKDLSRLNILFVIFVIVAVINWVTNYIMQYAMHWPTWSRHVHSTGVLDFKLYVLLCSSNFTL